MIRGRTSRRIARLAACACLALAGAAPATVGAQSAVDEYTLDIPGGGGSGSGQGSPPSSTAASGPASGSARTAGGRSADKGTGPNAARNSDTGGSGDLDDGRSGTTSASSDARPDHRSAPEVVADTLLDDAMLPILAALALITGIGAWRVLRHRHTPTGAAG